MARSPALPLPCGVTLVNLFFPVSCFTILDLESQQGDFTCAPFYQADPGKMPQLLASTAHLSPSSQISPAHGYLSSGKSERRDCCCCC